MPAQGGTAAGEHMTLDRPATEDVQAAPAHADTDQSGFRLITVAGADPMTVALFYPCRVVAQKTKMGIYSAKLAMNAPYPDSVKGLILISHGTGANELVHVNLAQSLAERGYLVAALRHPHDNMFDRSLASSPHYFTERPRQLSRVLDAILADPQWQGKIPDGHIGAIGHSAGGTSVVALAGGVADPQRIAEHCMGEPDDARFCELIAQQFSGQRDEALSAAGAIDFDVSDRRIRAAIVMAIQGVVFTPASLNAITVPLKIYLAEHDVFFSGKYHGGWVHSQVAHAELEEISNAGHFAFMTQPDRPVGELSENPEGFDRAQFHLRMEADAAAFFDRSF
jgi:predicted dienelactone hydrolase